MASSPAGLKKSVARAAGSARRTHVGALLAVIDLKQREGKGHRGEIVRKRHNNLGSLPMTLEDKVRAFRLHAPQRAKN